ncbi:MAG TPA: DNA-binding response regulator, partial [Flavobacteriales bacterium]|nr:DNA-binding response regulator [Flavobacteriales bacterium]
MDKIRILVTDDEIVVREGIVAILSLQPAFEVVGEASDGLEAIEIAHRTKPDVVLLDMAMPRQDGLTTIPVLKELLPDVRILVLTSFAESDTVYKAIKSGALGYMLKDARREQLIQAIHDVAKGQASISPSIALKVIQEVSHPTEVLYTSSPLTPRELETLRLIA